MNENIEVFVVYMAFFTLEITIYLAQKTQIALLFIKKIIVQEKYLDFANLFSKKSAEVLSKHMKVNKHAIKLEKGKLSSHCPIYNLALVELETLKTYIETNLANSFICRSNLLLGLQSFLSKS